MLGNYAEKVGKVASKTSDAYDTAYEKYSKMGWTQQKINKQLKSLKERRDYYQAQEKRREEERRAASATNRAQANTITNRLANEYKAQQQRDGRDFSVSGPDTSSNARGKSNQASSERGYAMHGADGGRVGAKDGGSMIQIVKDRLMEKNPAMWGLGYEGLASLQDLIMSMPFNQGGIVNIRRR
jgi:hypothetical protein